MPPKYKYIALGYLSLVPGLHRLLRRGTGGSTSARYCYSVWLRHLVLNAGLPEFRTRTIAELGPGDSLGIGLAALLSGAEKYFAMDALPHANPSRNTAVFDELVELFKSRAPIPDATEFPGVHPILSDYSFPHHVLSDERLAAALKPERLRTIRGDIERLSGYVSYMPRWYEQDQPRDQSVDLIISQAVMEHVDQLESAYRAMMGWLMPGGRISHQIDFKCHATAEKWNGHLAYSDRTWRMMRGGLPYFINRRAPTDHLLAAKAAGFEDVVMKRVMRDDGLPIESLAAGFRGWSPEDVRTSGAFFQARKPLTQSRTS